MSAMQIVQSKAPGDWITYDFDFSSMLKPNIYICAGTNPSVTASIWAGNDYSALPIITTVTAGASDVTTPVTIRGGTPGTVYKIRVTAQTSNQMQLSIVSYLAVVDDPI
jgi:hypothetical protein